MTAFTWDLEWRTTLFTACLLPALIALGFWQLDRADEKAALSAQVAARSTAQPLPLATLNTVPRDELPYRRVALRGRFLPDAVLLLDNQIRDGRYGHDVLGLFLDADSGLLAMVNRGWIPGDPSRRSLPEVEINGAELALSAVVYVPPGEPYVLEAQQFAELPWPLLIQNARSDALHRALEAETGLPLYPWVLRLEADQPEGFRRDWPTINISPQKHQGYAVQWFTMAAFLLLFFCLRSSNIASVLRGQKTTES